MQDSGADARDRVCRVQQAIDEKLKFMMETMAQVKLQGQANAADGQQERKEIRAVTDSLEQKLVFMCVLSRILCLFVRPS